MNALVNLVRAFCLFLAVISMSADAFDMDTVKIKVGKHHLTVPERYMIEPQIPIWLRWVPGLAPSEGGIILDIKAEDIAAEVPGYQIYDGRYKADCILLIQVKGEKELKTYLDPHWHYYSDMWYGRGFYSNRVVEKHARSGFYKLYDKGIESSWRAVRIYPDASQPIPDDPFAFWVASCLNGTSPRTRSGRITRCKTRIIYDDLLLDFGVAEFNLHLIDEVRAMMLRQLLLWKGEMVAVE